MESVTRKTFLLLSAFLIAAAGLINAQTEGQFTLSLYTTSTGGYSPKNVIAIWVESSAPSFVKTKLLQCSGSNLDHLALWTSRTGSNTVDATTGATRQTHGQITVVWNGTAVNGTVVPDGTYNVWVEMAWASSLTTGKTYSIFPFTKGPATFHSSPTNLTNFYGINLDWVPNSPTAIEKVHSTNEVSIYPNPANNIINVRFKEDHPDVSVRIMNESGVQVWKGALNGSAGSDKSIDITGLPGGIYFVNFHFDNKEEVLRLVKIN